MMNNSLIPNVFISYSWSDMDHELLNYIVFILNKLSDDKFIIHFDKNNSIGDNIDEFIDLLKIVDVVIIFCTPDYKRKVLNREQGGVYKEFNLIWQRYSQVKENFDIEKKRPFFDILPVVISGEKDNAIPNEIINILHEDLRGLYTSKNRQGKYIIPKHVRDKFLNKIDNISSRIKGIHNIKKESYKETWKELFKILFKESKSDWHKKESLKYIDHVFVKTTAYKKVRDQDLWFFVGRKGSGKTTLTDILPILNNDKFNLTVKIEAEDIYLQTVYTLFSSSKSFDSDTKHIYPRTKVLQFAWEVFIILSTMYSLQNNGGCEKKYQKQIIKKFLDDLLKNNNIIFSDSALNALFNHSFLKLKTFIEENIRETRADKFGADIGRNFSIKKFRDFVIPINVQNSFLRCLKLINKNILLSFDGFDSVFDEFRKESLLTGNIDEYNKRSLFEVNWLSSLILLILNQGIKKHSSYFLYQKFYYCITIPKDRFIEVRKRDRDTFRHFSKFAYIRWSGIELAILLRKRLEELSGLSTSREKRVEERLLDIFHKGFPKLPYYLEFNFNEKHYRIPLFIYVLRHTFWRPRDILFYFTSILSLYQEINKKKITLKTEEIRTVIKRTTYKVIDSEFINEFNTIILNFEEIIKAFKSQPQILSFKIISDLIENITFKKHSSIENIENINSKIEFLFNIGFLGFIVPNEIQKEYGIMKYAFSFNEGEFIYQKLNNASLSTYNFCIHPIFSEYLDIDTSNNHELIMVYDWEYLHKQEVYRNIDL